MSSITRWRRGVCVELLAGPRGVASGTELSRAGSRGLFHALQGVDAGGNAVEQRWIVSVGH
ncbi:MAG: hypothetical protein ACLQVF_18135 [Isosphaeraceae bacterium]